MEVQRRNCELYVQSQGWHINSDLIYIDEGHSGGTLERPGLTRLRQMIKKGAVDVVVVYKLGATQSLDTRDPLGKQFFYLLVGFAEPARKRPQ